MIIVLTSLGTCATYLIYLYGPLHAVTFHGMNLWKALLINSMSVILLTILIPFFGHLGDLYGKKILLLISSSMLLFLAYPFFWAISYGSLMAFLSIQMVMSIAVAIFHSLAPVLIVEIIPVKTRCTISGFLYGISASIFGASSPIISLYLIKYTGNYTSPAYYLLIFSLIALLTISCLLKENKKQKNTMPISIALKNVDIHSCK